MILTRNIDEFIAAPAIDARVRSAFEAFAALDDLMCVVEALCPVWPAKLIESGGAAYKL